MVSGTHPKILLCPAPNHIADTEDGHVPGAADTNENNSPTHPREYNRKAKLHGCASKRMPASSGSSCPFPNWTAQVMFTLLHKWRWSQAKYKFLLRILTDKRFRLEDIPSWPAARGMKKLIPMLQRLSISVRNKKMNKDQTVVFFDPLELLQRHMANPVTSQYMISTHDNPVWKSSPTHGSNFLTHPLFRQEVITFRGDKYWVGDVVEVRTEDGQDFIRIQSLFTRDGNWMFTGHWFWKQSEQNFTRRLQPPMHEQELLEDFTLENDLHMASILRKVTFKYSRRPVEGTDFFCYRKAVYTV